MTPSLNHPIASGVTRSGVGELFVLAMNEAKTEGWLYLGDHSAG